jgi:predicted enzyme related to lactoylglutathione lyase
VSDTVEKILGAIEWHDLTVPDAENVRAFYEQVVGWTSSPVDMGEYNDYGVDNAEGTVGGICHARGQNAAIPAMWVMYVRVASVNTSVEKCVELGGEVLTRNSYGEDDYAILRDTAGAAFGVIGKP